MVDGDKLSDLLKGITLEENAELRRMLTDLTAKLEKQEDEEPEDEREVVGMALQPHEHYDFLVVLCTTSQEWNVLCDKLDLKPEKRRGPDGDKQGDARKQADRKAGRLRLPHHRPVAPQGAQHAIAAAPAADGDRLRR